MRCVDCGVEMKKTVADYEYVESGLKGIILAKISVYQCPKCKRVYPIIPNIKRLHKLIAQRLVSKTSLISGKELVFLRKEMKIRAKDLAKIFGVHKVTISRWENDKKPINPMCDRLVRLLYGTKVFEERCEIARPRIKELRSPFANKFLNSLSNSMTSVEDILGNIQNRQIPSRVSIQRGWLEEPKTSDLSDIPSPFLASA